MSLRRGHPQPAVVEVGAVAALGAEQLVAQGVEDDAGGDLAMLLERDRDRPVRQAVQEVGGAVERVDDPAIVRRAAGLGAALLHDEAVVGPAALAAPP